MKRIMLLFFCFAIVACMKETKPSVKQIDIDFAQKEKVAFSLSQIFENVSYIKLDTSCLVGQIDEIRKFGETLYMCDKNEGTIHQYGMNGKYITSLKKRGRAKNEYIVLTDFDVSPVNGDIHIYDGGSKRFLVYSKEGIFKRTFHTDEIIRDFAILSNGDYLMYTPDKNGDAKRGLWQTDRVGKFRKQIVRIHDDFQYGGIYPQYLTHIDEKYIGLMGGEDADNFYIISEDTVGIQLHINYNISIPRELQREKNIDFAKHKGNVYTKNNYFESHRWIWFGTTDFDKMVVCFYDKNTDKCYKITGKDNVVEDVKLFGIPLSVYDDMMINVIYASGALSSPTLKEKFPDVTETSNPILEIVKITQ